MYSVREKKVHKLGLSNTFFTLGPFIQIRLTETKTLHRFY